jgi:hypothetical protein
LTRVRRQAGNHRNAGCNCFPASSGLQAHSPITGAVTARRVIQLPQVRQRAGAVTRTDASVPPTTGRRSRWASACLCREEIARDAVRVAHEFAAVQRSAKHRLPEPKTLSAITTCSTASDLLLSGGIFSSLHPAGTKPPCSCTQAPQDAIDFIRGRRRGSKNGRGDP